MKTKSNNNVSIIKAVAVILTVVVAFSIGAVLPFVAHAATGVYTMSVTSGPTVTGPYQISLSGVAAAAPETGNNGNQHVAVDWGTGAGYDTSFSGVTFNPTFANGGFTSTWSATHTYAAAGTYTIKIVVYHSQPTGQDGSDLATKTVTAIIPPATLKVIKIVNNTNGGIKTAADFNLHVTGTGIGTPSPANFSGSTSGTIISLFPGLSAGTFSVTEDAVAGYHQVSAVGCSGSVSSGNSLTCTITNTDDAPNHAPVANNGTLTTNQDAPANSTLSATDSDLNPLTFSIVGNPTHGSISNFIPSTGAFTYTPTNGFFGSDFFTFKANDGSVDSNTATVAITVNHVNHAPVASGDVYNTNEETQKVVSAPGVLSNDIDADSDTLTATIGTGPSHASDFHFNADGSFDYTPAANFAGSDTFTYTVSDGSLTSNATVEIIVSNVEDAPVAGNDEYTINEDTVLNGSTVLVNDTDADGGSITVNLPIESDVNDGTLSVNADGTFTYTPDANFCGTDSFSYRATDGSLMSGVAIVTINVTCVNDAPTADSLVVSTSQNVVLNSALHGADADGNTISYATTTNPVHGTLTVDSTTGAFVYTPNNGYLGADSFDFKVNDGTVDSNTATVSITVATVPENTQAACSDGIDNDGDEAIDLQDSDCASFIDVCPNIDGIQNTVPEGKHMSENQCVDNVVVTPPAPPSGGGNGGGGGGGGNGPIAGSLGGGGNGPIAGSVLGASTSTLPELPAGCNALLHTYMRMNKKNDTAEVKKLQKFLNDELNAGLPINGIFGAKTDAAVREFQKAHTPQVLTPWGITDPTGYVYKTTQRWINLTVCSSLNIPMPVLN